MLFDTPLIPGLSTRDEIIGPDVEASLIENIARLNLTPTSSVTGLGVRAIEE
ncbi:hypothetical protein SH584_04085 [Sphingomonas sp. LY29]|uniref:hypothetical protein n=1 Tax=Sphingomonas sp. LY29 TaxID=3095341 RepID=UPI002D78F40B|nr:hypothetical protein [Sphingomonas sp. LY29]WRP26621.1 hypothetical protein SH584_04085 [Sphingomonas sp. LY29]